MGCYGGTCDSAPVASLFRLRWLLSLVFLTSFGALRLQAQTGAAPPPSAGEATFVGSERCASCHKREHEAWKTSQHAHALQHARGAAVLGDFKDAKFDKDSVATTFLTRDSRFLIDTLGPDGKRGEFEVKFVLGLEPLQQYLVELPGGRLQAFGIAWDTRPAGDGGQRWFDLYPGQKLEPGDPLHWTGIQQNANYMCIDCHVTNLRKGFDGAANAYHSTWSEAGVGCEACHGPGSAHAAKPQVKLPAQYMARSKIAWGTDPAARPQVPPAARTAELETCARCHARRSQLTDDIHAGQSFGDGFRAALLERGLYHADGQMQDEVYNYGSFLQSRMFSKGVSCSDCHDPHTEKLRATGNGLCEQCHDANKYDTRAHHFHDPASKAGLCVSCHMPAVTYMIVDPRHDHSFRVPRPDLAQSLGVPDVCASCHGDKPAGWTAQELRKRLGHAPAGFQTFAEAFDTADRGAPGAAGQLAQIANDPAQPAIVRASALARADTGAIGINLSTSLDDADPLVRRAAIELVASGDIGQWAGQLVRLLQDPVREVRIEAAHALAGPGELRLSGEQRSAFRKALDEYVAVQRYNADRAEAHMNLALLEIRRGNGLLADEHLTRAIAIDASFVPAYLQLADLYRARRDEARAEQVLRQALERNRGSAEVHYALGLSLVRQHRSGPAMEELGRAAELGSASARFGYAYAVALDQSGNQAEARRVLDRVLAMHPYDVDSLTAGAIWAVRRRDSQAALGYLATLQALRPDDPGIRQEIERLRRAPAAPR
jgi:predicted CXXCH cytochrome family protein